MTIRKKLVMYYGVLLIISYTIAAVLTGIVINSGINRLLYANIYDLNQNIIQSIDAVQASDFTVTLAQAHQYTGVDLLVYSDGLVSYSSVDTSTFDVNDATLVSSRYHVYRLIIDDQYYYFTSSTLDNGQYQIYVIRGEGSLMNENKTFFLMSFIGIVFLAVSITLISVFSARTFATPPRLLAYYANNLTNRNKPEKRPDFGLLEYDELAKALEMAHLRVYEYNQSEQEFLHNFSHEMKTPLTNIYSYAEAIHYNMLSPEENHNASQIIMRESEKLKNFINQILYLGRLDQIGEKLSFQKVNLVDVVGDALNSIDIQAKDKNVKLTFLHEHENVYINADPDKLEVALVNLLTNAIRYAKTSVRITVDVIPDGVNLMFDDDGPGIEPEIRSQIWDRFFIGKEGHTGLGLTITKSIIEKHHSSIIIADNDMGGASFRIFFPVRK